MFLLFSLRRIFDTSTSLSLSLDSHVVVLRNILKSPSEKRCTQNKYKKCCRAVRRRKILYLLSREAGPGVKYIFQHKYALSCLFTLKRLRRDFWQARTKGGWCNYFAWVFNFTDSEGWQVRTLGAPPFSPFPVCSPALEWWNMVWSGLVFGMKWVRCLCVHGWGAPRMTNMMVMRHSQGKHEWH